MLPGIFLKRASLQRQTTQQISDLHQVNAWIASLWYIAILIMIYEWAAVGACFACEQVRQWPYHYLKTPREFVLSPTTNSWYCPGGDEPPKTCPTDQFVPSTNWSQCICAGATYPDPTNSSVCIPCPAGHYCIGGQKIQCPDHFYQDNTGQSTCKQCASRPDVLGEYNNCNGNKQLQICDSKKIETQNRTLEDNCVECSHCKRLYSSTTAGQLDCYKSYKAGLG